MGRLINTTMTADGVIDVGEWYVSKGDRDTTVLGDDRACTRLPRLDMVRRGSTVRVRQRALASRNCRAFTPRSDVPLVRPARGGNTEVSRRERSARGRRQFRPDHAGPRPARRGRAAPPSSSRPRSWPTRSRTVSSRDCGARLRGAEAAAPRSGRIRGAWADGHPARPDERHMTSALAGCRWPGRSRWPAVSSPSAGELLPADGLAEKLRTCLPPL
jgi:hypothetical protein